jgi:hypothetical protein
MAEGGSNYTGGLGDLLALIGSNNPFAGVSKSMTQFQRGVQQFLDSVERFNDTMDQLNGVAARINRLLDTVEPPIRAFVPQVTRTIRTADMMVEQLSGPIEKVAPGLARLAETLSSPLLMSIPSDLAEFMESLGDLARRLQPLGQLAETAGSMFGLRPLAALRVGGHRPEPSHPAPPPPPPPRPARAAKSSGATKKAAPRKQAARKAPAKKAPARRAPR